VPHRIRGKAFDWLKSEEGIGKDRNTRPVKIRIGGLVLKERPAPYP
jgi:hypothetical protein